MARALVLAALADVDAVTLFSDDTPHALIELVRPDILVKGADYALDQVVGASIVQGYGGEIYLAVLKEGYSTTSTIRSLRAKEAQ
jgi:D-beta-D-heptose 7-phosphate kinase/D-beta-D-heptose 1-phosphate adenosyltransferase